MTYASEVNTVVQWVELENKEEFLPSLRPMDEDEEYQDMYGNHMYYFDEPINTYCNVRGIGPTNHDNLKGLWDAIPSLTERLEAKGIDKADWIPCLFDESEQQDPIGIEGIVAHYNEMSQLDRWISESCYSGSSKVSRFQDKVTNGLLFWQKPEYLERKLNTDFLTAQKIIEAFNALEFRTKEAMWAINGIAKKKSVHAGFVWFVDLAQKMDKVTYSEEGDNIMTEQYIEDDEIEEDVEPDAPTPTTVQAIPIGDYDYFDPQQPWLRRQPSNYQELVDTLGSMELEDLSTIGNIIYTKKPEFKCEVKYINKDGKKQTKHIPLSNAQTSVFWSAYKSRKLTLEERTLPQFEKLMKFFISTKRTVAWKKQYLWELKAKNTIALSNTQWSALWALFKKPEKTVDPQQSLFTV